MNPQVAQIMATWLGPEGERERFAQRTEMIGHIKRWKDIEGVSNFRDLVVGKQNMPNMSNRIVFFAAQISVTLPISEDMLFNNLE